MCKCTAWHAIVAPDPRIAKIGITHCGTRTMGRETQKPVPWKTDASADKTRFAGKPRSLASSRRGSRAPSEAGDGANAEGDQTWKTTHDSAFGDSRPGSRLSHRSHATDEVVGFGDATSWRTTNREFQYDPNDFVPTPEKKHWDPNTADGRDPRGEIARRRSRIADPAGTGESGIGGWAGVPRMRIRKGAVDPLGGPDRGRSGVLMTHLEDGTARPEDEEPEAEKPFWTKRGVHPMRRKQPVGGSDVLTGLWMSSTTSYGMHAPDYQLTRREKTELAARKIELQNEAPHRPDHVLSAVVHNAFLVDEGGAKVARRVVADEKEDIKRKAAAAMEAKLHRDLKKLDV